jgi:hypothetical protein
MRKLVLAVIVLLALFVIFRAYSQGAGQRPAVAVIGKTNSASAAP